MGYAGVTPPAFLLQRFFCFCRFTRTYSLTFLCTCTPPLSRTTLIVGSDWIGIVHKGDVIWVIGDVVAARSTG